MMSLVCTVTGVRYPAGEPRWCGEGETLLDLEFEPRLDPRAIASRPFTLWRYREALPLLSDDAIVALGEAVTPLVPIVIDGCRVLIKQEQLFSTGSYKDRGAAVLISKANELGVRSVLQDSSGNAGVAVAAYCARAGIACTIYVPADVAPAKLTQLAWHGATVHRIPGPREECARAARSAARTTYYASHCWNPFFLHGTKTFAYELSEQLGWASPDTIVLPVGNGTILLGAAIGFTELLRQGIVSRFPRFIGVQSERCAPLAKAFDGPPLAVPQLRPPPTIAEGIAIAEPVRGPQILEAVRNSGGSFVTVTEEEILSALSLVAAQGFFIEPTAAATIAGLRKYIPGAARGERIVSVFTGHGLKSAEKLLALSSLS